MENALRKSKPMSRKWSLQFGMRPRALPSVLPRLCTWLSDVARHKKYGRAISLLANSLMRMLPEHGKRELGWHVYGGQAFPLQMTACSPGGSAMLSLWRSEFRGIPLTRTLGSPLEDPQALLSATFPQSSATSHLLRGPRKPWGRAAGRARYVHILHGATRLRNQFEHHPIFHLHQGYQARLLLHASYYDQILTFSLKETGTHGGHTGLVI